MSTKFRVGQQIVYINNLDDDLLYVFGVSLIDQNVKLDNLTYGKTYEVFEDSGLNWYNENEIVCVLNDNRNKILVDENKFISIKEYRKQKLNKIKNKNKIKYEN
jgi:hypothetical protein